MTMIDPFLRDAIELCVPQLREQCRDPWVIIGSAAAVLAGADVVAADLDVLTSAADAERLKTLWLSRLNVLHSPAHDDVFRSQFARFEFPPMAVEVMGGLEVCEGEAWQPVHIGEIVDAIYGGIHVPIPALSEQIRLLERFARPKDLLRLELLRAL